MSVVWCLRFVTWFSLFIPFSLLASPTVIDSTPQLRVEVGMHTSQIRRVIYHAAKQQLITCSDDKTVRVWQLPAMELVNVIRVPIQQGHEGQLFALALSPDGKTLAVAGWTGWEWEQNASVYLLDIETGDMKDRLSGFSNVINALLWLPNGQQLLVGMQGNSGLQLLNVKTHQRLAEDRDYSDDISDIDMHGERILVTSLDGSLHQYTLQLNLINKTRFAKREKPITAKYSPEGEYVAVAFHERPHVKILSSQTLHELSAVHSVALSELQGLTSLAWSGDKKWLYASGESISEVNNTVLQWSVDQLFKGISQNAKAFHPTKQRISELLALPDSTVIFLSEEPAIGRMSEQGKVLLRHEAESIRFRNHQLDISEDGAEIRFVDEKESKAHTFSVLSRQEIALNQPSQALWSRRAESIHFRMNDWLSTSTPLLNGIPVALEDYERIRTFAFSHDQQYVVLGTEWSLRYLDRQANESWHVAIPAVAYAVNVSRNGRFVIAALSDGTIRWYLTQTGREVLAYFPHANQEDWICWMPDGVYNASLYGDQYIGWLINRTLDRRPDFFRAVQFERALYQPNTIQQRFVNWIQDASQDISLRNTAGNQILSLAPPVIKVQLQAIEEHEGNPQARFLVTAERRAFPIKQLVAYLNDIPMTPYAIRQVNSNDQNYVEREFILPLSNGRNSIRIESATEKSIGVGEYILQGGSLASEPKKGNLYILAIGANAFPNLPKKDYLSYAAQDAISFAEQLSAKSASQYNQVYVKTLSDNLGEKPKRANILAALTWLAQSQPEDTVVLFLASHGMTDSGGNYVFLPRDVTQEDIHTLYSTAEQTSRVDSSLLSWEVFFNALQNASGKRLLVVDTCHAKTIEGTFSSYALAKRSAASRYTLLVSSKEQENSQEYPAKQHGLFTYALLEAMAPDSDLDRNQSISIKEWFTASAGTVQRLHNRLVGSQTPQMVVPKTMEPLAIIPVQ